MPGQRAPKKGVPTGTPSEATRTQKTLTPPTIQSTGETTDLVSLDQPLWTSKDADFEYLLPLHSRSPLTIASEIVNNKDRGGDLFE